MPIVRVFKRTNPYVIIEKTCLNDQELSWKAKGLHSYLMSLPDDWDISTSDLQERAKDGRDSVLSTLKELQQAGYLKRTMKRAPNGQTMGYEYEVFECPQEDVINQQQNTDKPAGDSLSETRFLDKTDINDFSVMSVRHEKYLKAAFDKTVNRYNLKVSNPEELWHQVLYFMQNPQQHKHTKSFKHAVNCCMKILADGQWRTPIGFAKHDPVGIKIKQQQMQQMQQEQAYKKSKTSPKKHFKDGGKEDETEKEQKNKTKQHLSVGAGASVSAEPVTTGELIAKLREEIDRFTRFATGKPGGILKVIESSIKLKKQDLENLIAKTTALG